MKFVYASPLLAALLLASTSPAWAQPPKPLDALTAYFIHLKLAGETVDFNALADRTQKVMQAKGFGKIAIRALEATQLKSKYEAADPEALYALSLQTLLTYDINDGRFLVQSFEPGRVLPLDPFGPRTAHRMAGNFAGQFAFHMSFLNAAEARYVPLEQDKARVIDPVARAGVTGAVAEIMLRFVKSDAQQKMLHAQAESVRYRYAAAPGLVRMANIHLWPLNETFPVAAVDPSETPVGATVVDAAGGTAGAAGAAVASEPVPPPAVPEVVQRLDQLTLFFIYHKLSGEPIDFDAIARKTNAVWRASAFDKDKVATAEAAAMRVKFDAADPHATYSLGLRTTLHYQMNKQQFEVETFGPDRFMNFSTFAPSGGTHDHQFADQLQAYRYGRRLTFVNAASARYVPVPTEQARAIGAHANVVVEVHFKLADAIDAPVESEKTVRAQILTMQINPGIGKPPANWPFGKPIAVAPVDLSSPTAGIDSSGTPGDTGHRLDNWTVYFLYAKVAGDPIDFEGIAERSDNVRRAAQFEKAEALAREVARLREQFDAIDPKGTFSLRVGGNLHYEMDHERFRAELFDPGKFVNFNPMASGTREFARSQRRVAFANADAVRYIPVSRDKAGQVDQVRRLGNTGASAELELTVVGIGDPAGAVESEGTLRMAVRSVRFHGTRPGPNDVWPLEAAITPPAWSNRMDPPVIAFDKFDTMGLKTGIRLDALKRTVETEFGPMVNINPMRNEDPRLKSGVGFSPDSCFAFGNKVPAAGTVCIRAYADDGGIVRKIIVEQILEGADWEPTRMALLDKYGAMADAMRKAQTQYYGWGPLVTRTITSEDSLAPNRALTATLSPLQSGIDRMSASTRVSTNLRVRLIDPKWAGAPAEPVVATSKERPAPAKTPRL